MRLSLSGLRGAKGSKRNSKLYDVAAQELVASRQRHHPNPLTRYGKRGFSQSDEDGITFEIIRRLGIQNGTFAEFGVGDGLENNTLALLAAGWSGFWVGGEDLAFDTQKSSRLNYQKAWIDRENALPLFQNGLNNIGREEVDVLSIDLDGNDLYICQELLGSGLQPLLVILECNAKFPPPMRFCIEYNAKHNWAKDDYYGASLASLADMMMAFEYTLICCNAATGSNAFFIRQADRHLFPEVPEAIGQIYAQPNHLLPHKHGHSTSLKTIQHMIE
ncbi:MAG: hypothetical protein AB8B88_04085 [Devosiaceae bacterium]